ncbi:caldesmon-like [Camellia sinensis]|uniref:caldesmon-like n=1 Tax=Camellia sinensis TaxID=4442 RepID=UPI0010365125|nr:caldesmon-like [Camellia sinensis]
MAKESLSKLARKKNADCLAARQKAKAITSKTALPESSESVVVVETAQIVSVETERSAKCLTPEADKGREKRPADFEAVSEEIPVEKRPRLEESDMVVPFVVQSKIKNMSISSDASAVKDPVVALSLASSVLLPADKTAFCSESDVLAIALAAQTALLTVGKIVEIGRRQHDAVEEIGRLRSEVEGERSRANFEAARAMMKSARAEAEMERAKKAEEQRLVAEQRASASDEALKSAQEVIGKLENELEELKKAKEKADSETSKAYEAGQDAALESYAEEAPKFENRGFKHGWLKALVAANVTLAMPIPYEQGDLHV